MSCEIVLVLPEEKKYKCKGGFPFQTLHLCLKCRMYNYFITVTWSVQMSTFEKWNYSVCMR